ncbi:hypothetical protein PVK06_012115 [Gossypium arboreum]|uniref:Uncharacterized protein n=1 Tax=Gossypium arboreum TaxID=29729 RepID=A0ABR0QB94_GOSAR|nr:hypothetical protein PVK06_012115 [Gossypium arboreum]
MAVTLEHCYSTRRKTEAMDQRLKKLEQMQIQMQKQLAKIQQDMRDQMLEFQRNMMSQLTQLLVEGLEKGKNPMVNAGMITRTLLILQDLAQQIHKHNQTRIHKGCSITSNPNTRSPPYCKWYDANAQCEYHAGITGHSIENCTAFEKIIERLIKMGIVKFDDPSGAENSLPNHSDKGVNAIINSVGKRIKIDVVKVKIPLREVWKKMVEGGLIT